MQTNYTALLTDSIILMDTPAGIVLTLPTAIGNSGKTYRISNAGADAFTLVTLGGAIQWLASQTINPQTQKMVVSDGNNWFWC